MALIPLADALTLKKVYRYGGGMTEVIPNVVRGNERVERTGHRIKFYTTARGWDIENVSEYFSVFGKVETVKKMEGGFKVRFVTRETAKNVVRAYGHIMDTPLYRGLKNSMMM